MPAEVPENRGRIEDRIGGLEVGYDRLSKDVAGLGRQFREFSAEIRTIVQAQQRTPWGVLAAWTGVAATLVLGVGAIVSVGIASDLLRVDESIKKDAELFREHEKLDSHPALRVKVESLEKASSKLDEKIQIEIRIADERLQAEIEAEANRITRIEGVMSSDDAREASDAAIHAAVWERILGIERKLFGGMLPSSMRGRAEGAR